MDATTSRSAAGELVSLAERMIYMHVFRIAAASVALLYGVLAPEAIGAPLTEIALGTGVFLLVSLLGEGAWRLSRRRGLTLFGAMLITDGFYLAWLTYTTGGSASPLRYLIILHLVPVALLASYRTGMKLALWHSLLLIAVFHAQEAELLDATEAAAALPGSEMQRLIGFAALLWLVAVATASFSAVNERELRRRRFDLEALATLATELDAVHDPRSIADVVLANLGDAFGFERALLVGHGDDGLFAITSRGCERSASIDAVVGSGSVLHRALEARRTLLVSEFDARSDAWLSKVFPAGHNFVVAPLIAEEPIGVLVAEHGLRRGSRIERRVASMVERFADHAALALRNGYLLEQLERTAATDGLTMIANRRTFDTALDQELSRASRSEDQLSVAIVDVDNFKRLNDEHGHQVGDEVLRDLAGLLTRHCREFDTAARYGGEEFALILPACDQEQALAVTERLRELVEQADTTAPLTVSIGVATFPRDGAERADLVRAADEALYESKRAGRNRVTGTTSDDEWSEMPDRQSPVA